MEKLLNRLLVLSFCFPALLLAQPSEVDLHDLDKFAKADFYYLLYREDVKIEIVKNAILNTTSTNKIFCYNNYKNTGYSSSEIVYNSAFSEIKNLEAVSYSLEKGKYKKHEVKDFPISSYAESSSFEDAYKQISFTMLSVNNGTIGQIKYDEVNREPHFSNSFFFKQFVPIAKNEFIVEVDQGIEIAYKFIGDSSNISFEKTSKGDKVIYKWSSRDIETIKHEDYMPRLNKISSQVVCWVKNATINGQRTLINNDINSFSGWIYGVSKSAFNGPLNDEAKQFVDSLKRLNLSTFQLGQGIFKQVQKNIKYIAFENGMHGFVPRKPADVYYKRYGDCKDKATLLSAMLNYAGIESKTALVGTNAIIYRFSELPIPECANHMITAVKLNGTWAIADATDEYDSYLSVPESLQGQEALILIDSTHNFIYKIPTMPYYKTGRLDSLDISINNMEIKGSGRTYLYGYMKENVMEAIESYNDEKVKEFYKGLLDIGNNKCEYINVMYKMLNDTSMVLTYTISLPSYITQFENKFYLNPHLFKSGIDDYRVDSTKQYPVEFKFLSFTKHVVRVSAKDLSLSHMPVGTAEKRLSSGLLLTT